jgi:hypothetical protein
MSQTRPERGGPPDSRPTEISRTSRDRDRRVALALGPQALDDARHLLAPIRLPAPPRTMPDPGRRSGPDPNLEFVVDLIGEPVSAGALSERFTAEARLILGFPRLWARLPGAPPGDVRWLRLADVAADVPLGAIAVTWPLTSLPTSPIEAAAELARYLGALRSYVGMPLRRSAVPRETPLEAAARAERWLRIKDRFAHAVELRLMAQGKPFSARDIWRAAYALGLAWGEMNLFHWSDAATGVPLFTLSATGEPGYFLPERAVEGERVAGIALGFELPTAGAPLEAFDRLAIALDYFRQQIGGRPTVAGGRELDAEQLDGERDAIEEAVREMTHAGIPPGSADAARLF